MWLKIIKKSDFFNQQKNGSYNKAAADVVLKLNKNDGFSRTLLEINNAEHPEFHCESEWLKL
jgi:hypothetical protein